MLVEESLSGETIEISDTANNATDVISRLSDKLAGILEVDREVIERAVLTREQARTTAFTNGAAIPHCRLPDLKRFGIAMMILRQPIRWDNEGHAVDTVMLIAGPSKNVPDHLRILANSSQLLDSPALRAKLKQAPDNGSAYKLMVAAEQAVERRRSEEGMLRELRKDQANGTDHLSGVVRDFDW